MIPTSKRFAQLQLGCTAITCLFVIGSSWIYSAMELQWGRNGLIALIVATAWLSGGIHGAALAFRGPAPRLLCFGSAVLSWTVVVGVWMLLVVPLMPEFSWGRVATLSGWALVGFVPVLAGTEAARAACKVVRWPSSLLERSDSRRTEREWRALDDIDIAAPCSARWEDMAGDERVRHCAHCKLNVYDLSAMSRDEAMNFVQRIEGRACVRFFRRADGTVLTADCANRVRAATRRLAGVTASALVFVLATVAATIPLARRTLGSLGVEHIRNVEPIKTAVDEVSPSPQVFLGAVCLPPPAGGGNSSSGSGTSDDSPPDEFDF